MATGGAAFGSVSCDPAPVVKAPVIPCEPCEGTDVLCDEPLGVQGFIVNTSCTAGMSIALEAGGQQRLRALHGNISYVQHGGPSVLLLQDCAEDGTATLWFKYADDPTYTKLYWWIWTAAPGIAIVGANVPESEDVSLSSDRFYAWEREGATTCSDFSLRISGVNSGEEVFFPYAGQTTLVVTIAGITSGGAGVPLAYGDIIVGHSLLSLEGIGSIAPAQVMPITFRVAGAGNAGEVAAVFE